MLLEQLEENQYELVSLWKDLHCIDQPGDVDSIVYKGHMPYICLGQYIVGLN